MNSHKNARLTFEGRKLLIERIALLGLKAAAQAVGISVSTARKWQKRFEEHGLTGLMDRSSRPATTRSTVDAPLLLRIEQLRRHRMPMRRIAATVSRARMGLSSLSLAASISGLLQRSQAALGLGLSATRFPPERE